MTSTGDPSLQNIELLSADALAASLASLVKINSVNPAHGGPPGGEAEAIVWAQEFLRGYGLEAKLEEAFPGRPNLIARLPGRDATRTFVFETHVDTVSIENMEIDPFGAEVRQGRLWGRGSTDAKAQATAMLHAIASLAREGVVPEVNVELVLAVDEESGFGGVKSWVAGLENRDPQAGRIVAAVVGEPTGLEVVIAHKGSVRWWIALAGRAAHSSTPHRGVNAIRHASALVELIEGEYAESLAERSHEFLGFPTINVSVIEGGTQVNLVPDRARLLLDRRMIPGESWATVRPEIEALLERMKARFPEADATLEPPLLEDPCLETAPGHPLIAHALEVSGAFGRSGKPIGVSYCTDASNISAAGIPTIVVGPGSIDQAHTTDEWMDLGELREGALFYRELMSRDPEDGADGEGSRA